MTATQAARTPRRTSQPESLLKTIVVAIDFSTRATAMLQWASDVAKAHGAKIILVHAIESEVPQLPETHAAIVKHVGHRLDLIRASLGANKISAQSRFEAGRPWEVIASIATEAHADLIVVGAHGHSKPSERILGTVADRLIRSTSIPVLVHRDWKPEFRTVLAANDFSEESALALSAAVRLLRGSAKPVRLVLFHAVPPPMTYVDANLPLLVPQYWDAADQGALRQLEALACTLRSDQLQVEAKTLRGYAAEAILHEAETIKADLIAIGSVGRTGLNRFLMGSVAQRVLHQAQCPVLTARRPDPGTPVQISST